VKKQKMLLRMPVMQWKRRERSWRTLLIKQNLLIC
jgi:hypothetical protein